MSNGLRNIKDNIKKGMGKITLDGWSNVLTGLNISTKDKNTAAVIDWERTNRSQVESLFSSDDIAGKIAKMIPFDGCREGITWKVPSEVSNDATTDILNHLDAEFERLEAWETFNWAWTIARAYGGALIYVAVDDGQEPDQPLVVDRIRKINSLKVIDRWDLTVSSADIIKDIGDPGFGTPEMYLYSSGSAGAITAGADLVRIHHSRVIRFDGERLPTRLYVKNNYWHDSIYQRLYDAIRNYTTGHGNIATILQEVNQPVFKIDGLHEAISQDMDELILKRLQIVNMLRSSMRAVCLDKEDDFSFMQTALAGVGDLMKLATNRLVAATDIPHTRLLGESPGAALGEGGKSELTDYYDVVAAMQEVELRKPVHRLKELIFGQAENKQAEPEGLTFEFDPLYQQDQEAVIRTRKMQADMDQIYMQNGVYDAHEVAESRFGTGEYSYETSIEIEERESAEFTEPEQDDIDIENSPQKPAANKDLEPKGKMSATVGAQGVEVSAESEGSSAADPQSIVSQVDPTSLLNGAQVTAILTIVQQVGTGVLNKETATALIKQSFGMSDEQVSSILDPIEVKEPEPMPDFTPKAGPKEEPEEEPEEK